MATWTIDQIKDQTGRTAIVTGANTGIGFETARTLAQRGATVVLACRNPEKGNDALAKIEAVAPGKASLATLDLSDLESVKAFADEFTKTRDRLDLLINNAGVMIPPFGRTKQGFELQFGTNHLGHFALGAHLMPLLRKTPNSRIVVVHSSAHRGGVIDFSDLNYEKRPYKAWQAYCQSKLANVAYVVELQRRLAGIPGAPRVTAAHPGYTATDLQRSSSLLQLLNRFVAMAPAGGAAPTLRAAVDDEPTNDTFFAPSRFFESSGPPTTGAITADKRDPDVARRLWEVSETLTGVRYDLNA